MCAQLQSHWAPYSFRSITNSRGLAAHTLRCFQHAYTHHRRAYGRLVSCGERCVCIQGSVQNVPLNMHVVFASQFSVCNLHRTGGGNACVFNHSISVFSLWLRLKYRLHAPFIEFTHWCHGPVYWIFLSFFFLLHRALMLFKSPSLTQTVRNGLNLDQSETLGTI